MPPSWHPSRDLARTPRQRFAGTLKRYNLSRELPRGYADVLLLQFIWRQRSCRRQASSWTCNFWSLNCIFTTVRTRAQRVSP
jgi:hypothetical protein